LVYVSYYNRRTRRIRIALEVDIGKRREAEREIRPGTEGGMRMSGMAESEGGVRVSGMAE
jgi:hypothetical protein